MYLTVYISANELEKIVEHDKDENKEKKPIKIFGNLKRNTNRFIQVSVKVENINTFFEQTENISFMY